MLVRPSQHGSVRATNRMLNRCRGPAVGLPVGRASPPSVDQPIDGCPAKPSEQAIAVRDLAKRARRLAGTLTVADDVARLLRYADELEAQAADLERRANEDC